MEPMIKPLLATVEKLLTSWLCYIKLLAHLFECVIQIIFNIIEKKDVVQCIQ